MRSVAPLGSTGTTKVDMVCAAIREQILSGELPPRSRLVLRQLATQLNVSDIPVREAFQRLQAEGLITIVPHVGAVVADLSRFDILQNLLLRADLESLAAGMAVMFATPELIAELQRLVQEMDRCVADVRWDEYALLNKEFHRRLLESCPLPRIRSLSYELWEAGQRTRFLFHDPQVTFRSNEEHREMLETLRIGDAARMQALVRQQKWRSIRRLMRDLTGDELSKAKALLKLFPEMAGE